MYHLYIIQSESGCSKIGISSDAVRRLNEAQTDNHEKLSLYLIKELQSIQDAALLEFSLHTILAPYRKHREWFNISKDVLIAICNLLGVHGDISILPNTTNRANKRHNAKEVVRVHLEKNPHDIDKTVRELAEILGVGKSTVSDVKRELLSSANGQSMNGNGANDTL